MLPILVGFLAGLATGIGGLGWQRRRRRNRRRANLPETISVPDQLAQILPSAFQPEALAKSSVGEPSESALGLSRRLRALERSLLAAPVGFLTIDGENQLSWFNPRAAELLQIDRQQFKTPRLFLEVVRSYELDQLVEQARRTQTHCHAEWTFHAASPDPVDLSASISTPLRGHAFPMGNGEIGVYIESRQEAMRLVQQRDRWTSDVAHELKTPLTSIRLVAETLRSRVPTSLQNWLDRLLNETIRLSNLVDDLLNLSQLEDHHFQGIKPRQVDLPKLVQSAWQSLEPLAMIKHLYLGYDGPPQLVGQLDESLVYRMIINVLDNAIKHSPPRSEIQVRLTADADRSGSLLLEVIDCGNGFIEKDLPYIFDRFYRADPSRRRDTPAAVSLASETLGTQSPETSLEKPPKKPPEKLSEVDKNGSSRSRGGTGLGLSIVRQIVEAHQGHIQARNHPQTGGAWLKIYLPQSDLAAIADSASSTSVPSG
ncbi:MAG: PAS domain-containing sensor histidine kinase [Cyanobacteria bacterium P01_H01_bin.119]